MFDSAGIRWLLGVCAIADELFSFDFYVLGSLLMGAMENLYDDGSVFVEYAADVTHFPF